MMQRKINKMWVDVKLSVEAFIQRHGHSADIRFPDLVIHPIGDSAQVRLNKPIECSNWPFKQSGQKPCHIFICGKFECHSIDNQSNSQLELSSYVTEIAYYQPEKRVEPKRVKSLDGYHFDMDDQLKIAHPVFHAQRRPNLLGHAISNMGYEITNGGTSDTLHHIRLATPQFDVISALIMVLADHLVSAADENEDAFLELVNKIHEKNKLKATPANQAHLADCISNSEFLLGHWYAAGG